MHIFRRLLRMLHGEVSNFRPRLMLAYILVAPFPMNTGSRVRAAALRLAGFRIGRGVFFAGMPRIVGNGPITKRLTIGNHCFFNIGLTMELGADISIGQRVSLGHDVMLLTASHEIGPAECRCGPHTYAPIHIGDGVWIGARSVVLPGVTIGKGAVVGAGSVVNRNVSADTVVAGVPARPVKTLDETSRALQVASLHLAKSEQL